MPLVQSSLESQIMTLLDELSTNQDATQARQLFASRLATTITNYIKTATVNVTVTTTGTAAAQAGTGTGTLT